jgi:flagellar hook-associated protein 3 FlgL
MRAYGVEVNTLIEQAITGANQKFDGKFLLGGTKTDTAPFTVIRDADGKVTSASYVGAAQGAAFQVSETANVSPYTDGATNTELATFINRLVSVRDALENGDVAAVSALRPGLQDSEDAVLGTLGKIGAQQRRIEMSQETAVARFEETSARISDHNDVDLSQAIVELTRSQTAYQAALQTTAKIMSQSLLDYI